MNKPFSDYDYEYSLFIVDNYISQRDIVIIIVNIFSNINLICLFYII